MKNQNSPPAPQIVPQQPAPQLPPPSCPMAGMFGVPIAKATGGFKGMKGEMEIQINTLPCTPRCPLWVDTTEEEDEPAGDCSIKVIAMTFMSAMQLIRMTEDVVYNYGLAAGAFKPGEYEELEDDDGEDGDDDGGSPEPTEPVPQPAEA